MPPAPCHLPGHGKGQHCRQAHGTNASGQRPISASTSGCGHPARLSRRPLPLQPGHSGTIRLPAAQWRAAHVCVRRWCGPVGARPQGGLPRCRAAAAGSPWMQCGPSLFSGTPKPAAGSHACKSTASSSGRRPGCATWGSCWTTEMTSARPPSSSVPGRPPRL